ncbi:MAG: aldehyde dehydrogenase family protein, partial [Bacteroidia bacterium]|nr:aldehyde dehydrogenase family protein [Bacteroidia bacterium]
MTKEEVFRLLGLSEIVPAIVCGTKPLSVANKTRDIFSPVDGEKIGVVEFADQNSYDLAVNEAQRAFLTWREIPAPKRGEIVRQIGEALRKHKEALGWLVSYEMGKIYQEGLGEVQEMIDICDFAVGLSRQLYGLTMHSERPRHRMYEQWHPLGVVGVISAFNFPVAVWAWNAMIAAVCGDTVVWKPSEKTPFCALACQNIISKVLAANNLPDGLFVLIQGDREIGELLANDTRIPLISATGSTKMGKAVGEAVAKRLGKSLLELGGNNAIIITPHADLKLAIPATLFGAVGTCGQRCTTTRRLIIHESIYEQVKEALVRAYSSLTSKIGSPLEETTLIGPLIDKDAVSSMQARLKQVIQEGGKIIFGGEVLRKEPGTYVVPAIVEAENHMESVQQETFAPILYLMRYRTLEEAIELQNSVPQGLSSSIFTTNMKEMEQFLCCGGSDCGIANV